MEWSATRRRISLTTNTPLHRFSAYQPIGIDKRLFTPLERQRLILSILQARPIDDGAAVDTLMATKDDRSMAWRMALPPEKQSEQEDFDDALLAKSGIDMETEADLLRYEAKGGSVLTHVFAVHDIRTRYRIHQKWHRGCPRLYGPARTLRDLGHFAALQNLELLKDEEEEKAFLVAAFEYLHRAHDE